MDEDDECDDEVTMDDLWEQYGPASMDDPDDDNWDISARYDD